MCTGPIDKVEERKSQSSSNDQRMYEENSATRQGNEEAKIGMPWHIFIIVKINHNWHWQNIHTRLLFW